MKKLLIKILKTKAGKTVFLVIVESLIHEIKYVVDKKIIERVPEGAEKNTVQIIVDDIFTEIGLDAESITNIILQKK